MTPTPEVVAEIEAELSRAGFSCAPYCEHFCDRCGKWVQLSSIARWVAEREERLRAQGLADRGYQSENGRLAARVAALEREVARHHRDFDRWEQDALNEKRRADALAKECKLLRGVEAAWRSTVYNEKLVDVANTAIAALDAHRKGAGK